jgi:hypothetical protein
LLCSIFSWDFSLGFSLKVVSVFVGFSLCILYVHVSYFSLLQNLSSTSPGNLHRICVDQIETSVEVLPLTTL